MKKTLILLLAPAILFIACKNLTGESSAEEDAAAAQKALEKNCYIATRAHILTISEKAGATLDTLIITGIDTTTERSAMIHICEAVAKLKKATDHYVEAQKMVVDAAAKVHASLAETEKLRLQEGLAKQMQAEIELAACEDKINAADGDHYNFYLVTAEAIRTTPKGKDTLRGPFYIDKNFAVKNKL